MPKIDTNGTRAVSVQKPLNIHSSRAGNIKELKSHIQSNFVDTGKDTLDADGRLSAGQERHAELQPTTSVKMSAPAKKTMGTKIQSRDAAIFFNRGLPFIQNLSNEKYDENICAVVSHGVGEELSSVITNDDVNNCPYGKVILMYMLAVKDLAPGRQDEEVIRVLVAILFRKGILVNRDEEMATHMLSYVHPSEQASALTGALLVGTGGNLQLMQGAFELGADANREREDDNMLPLDSALNANTPLCVKMLLDNGADPDLVGNNSHESPREYIVHYGTPQLKEVLQAWDRSR